ncbi:MAG: DNA polymerase III subunit chi [Burkholderiales bacterium]|nr:DNA polymerase III subunit chi [Burkholderiales bacterium]MDR4518578.1 DNA polymerase III subunit chi [Nitrosomonas sp.]
MTEIYFYSGAADKLQVACRLCAKALSHGTRMMIFSADTSVLKKLDILLWTFQPTSFLPHCCIDDEKLVESTPIILSTRVLAGSDCDVLINLHDQCPPALEQFKRVIEIAGFSAEDKSAARERYRFYQQTGYELHHHKLA